MEYHEAANFLFDLRRFRSSPGTASTADLLAHLEDPHDGLACVQIAGSNGKGSTARMVERVLREAGLSVGLYTSPHLEDVRERVRVDGRKLPRSELAAFVESSEDYIRDCAADGDSPTFFEAMTALALWHFGREDVDVVVLEVGIGGKFDATSVVDPVASAVTSVTLEHTAVLGDTIEEIARDKAHVAPDGETPLVTGTTGEALAAVREHAGEVLTVGSDGDDETDVTVSYGGRTNHTEAAVSIAGQWEPPLETKIPLLGEHQAENAGIAAVLARQAADVSDADLSRADLERGLRNAHWPGRFEVMDREPFVVLDGAHNPGACERVAETLSTFEYDDLHLVFGAMHDKDHREMVAALPTPDSVITCRPNLERAEDEEVLAEVFAQTGVEDVRHRAAVQDAFADALEDAEPGDAVVVTGSLFAVAEARSRYTRAMIPKRIRNLDDARDALESASVTEEGVWRMRGKAVHRVVKTNLQYRQASYLKQELLSIGGECALSGLQRDEELVDVVLMGTLSQFKRLIEKLEAQPYGLATVARELREGLEIGIEPSEPRYPWQERSSVMGILNVTPDSFHDGGEYNAVEDAVDRAEAMVEAGVDVIDIGGESTRPGAEHVPVETETDRIVPVIERVRELDALVSVDTRKAAVAEAALEAGADILNDVSGLEDPEMRFVAAEHDVPLCVMHSIDAPVVAGRDVTYDDVVEDVVDQLTERILLAEKAGLDREQIIVDPGLGFGKSPTESFELLGRLEELQALGCPILVGHSHKSMFEKAGCGPDERGAATVAASALAVDRGADIVRVHDVPENVAAVRTALAARDPRGFDGDD
ncbi:dihydropteroate synthase [Halobacteria archaeon AArc-m2/3/4]|uniref:dihydropteroate synthase n=1 Tax=Natronoglomus mannanivorans TaxID=2979990 RepID=A0ABT2QIB8_9EURY|nr:dihydropteroate synthase [Halobacteria archaeon AArc-m2/3/4]